MQSILNLTVLPLSHDFHPVYLAAAYLNWVRQLLCQQAPKNELSLPAQIGGHPWFAFVDPAIDEGELTFVTQNIIHYYNFFEKLNAEQAANTCGAKVETG